MGLWNEPISTIRKRLTDWLIVSPTGGNVENLDLDLLNRANQWLQSYRQWDMLIKMVTLSLDASRTATLPTDLKSILEVYSDDANIGKPTIWFYEDCPDVAFRYTKSYVYDKSTGGYWTIQFPSVSPLLSNPKLKYVQVLPDFTGTDAMGAAITEYSFFPPNLLLRCAQKIFSEEKGLTGDNINATLLSFREELAMFESVAQFNNQQPDLTPKNKYGMPIKIATYSMDGRGMRRSDSPYTPAQQAGFHGY